MAENNQQKTGTVVAAHGRRGMLEIAQGERIPYLIQGRQLSAVCGDVAHWQDSEDGSIAVITDLQNRANQLERQPAHDTRTETLAANLTMMVVVCAAEPEPDWFLVDRFLCSATLMNCQPLLLMNKTELLDKEAAPLEHLSEYERIGYPVLRVSAEKNSGITALREQLSGHVAILVGQSGVGKSSLINCLVPEADISTQAISTATQEGKHTTTASAMHDLPNGGRLIDTPGVRDFIPAIPELTAIQVGFAEFEQPAGRCKYSNCLHLREPSCGVKQAVESGEISKRRYESYKRLCNIVKGKPAY